MATTNAQSRLCDAFALNLRGLRGKRSQMDIAAKLDIGVRTYRRLENFGKSNPTIKTMEKVAELYNVKVVELLIFQSEWYGNF